MTDTGRTVGATTSAGFSTSSARKCAIALCPALPEPDGTLCRLHKRARRALGLSGVRCSVCQRLLQPTDYIERHVIDDITQYRHVACEPVRPRKVTTRPLLDIAEGGD